MEAAQPTREAGRRDRFKWALCILALWTLFGFAESNQTYFAMMSHGHSWWTIVAWCTLCWLTCAFLTPAILYLGRKFPFERPHVLKSVAVHILGYLAFAAIQSTATIWLSQVINPYKPFNPPYIPWSQFYEWTLGQLVINLFAYGMIVMIGYALDYRDRFAERAKREAQLEALLSRAEVSSLKAQLRPHFLFNTLNGIVSLVRTKDTDAAEKMILHLSSMLRHSLDNSSLQETALSDELEFLNFYLQIEQTRFSDRLRFEIDVQPEALGAKVPSLILQPIVENAIRHGVGPKRGPVCVSIRVWIEGARLNIEVLDDGVGLAEKTATTQKGGLGLANTAARLTHLYGQDQSFDIRNRSEGGVRVSISIPYSIKEEEMAS
jgi:two-component system, LytTR family, sensor kinase